MARKPIEDAHPVDVHVGQRIRQLRHDTKVSQQALAEGVGVTFQQVQKYERGANRVSASMMVLIATVLGVKPSYFVDEAPGALDAAPEGDPAHVALQCLSEIPHGLDMLKSLAALPAEHQRLVAQMILALA